MYPRPLLFLVLQKNIIIHLDILRHEDRWLNIVKHSLENDENCLMKKPYFFAKHTIITLDILRHEDKSNNVLKHYLGNDENSWAKKTFFMIAFFVLRTTQALLLILSHMKINRTTFPSTSLANNGNCLVKKTCCYFEDCVLGLSFREPHHPCILEAPS